MNAWNIGVSEGITALEENQELNVYMQTPDGKKARNAAEREIRVIEAVVEHGDNVAGALLLDAYVLARQAAEERHPVWDEFARCQSRPRKPT